MGTVIHKAFVVTSWDKDLLNAAHTFASGDDQVGRLVSPIIKSNVNLYLSFFIAPDGSKQGWPDLAAADAGRARVIKWLEAQAYEDGSNALEWCCVPFGHDHAARTQEGKE